MPRKEPVVLQNTWALLNEALAAVAMMLMQRSDLSNQRSLPDIGMSTDSQSYSS